MGLKQRTKAGFWNTSHLFIIEESFDGRNMIFRKWGGGQRPFGTFPKIHLFWCGHATDNDDDDDYEEIADSKADGALTLKRTQAGKPELSNAISCLAVRRRWRLSKMMMMGIMVMMMTVMMNSTSKNGIENNLFHNHPGIWTLTTGTYLNKTKLDYIGPRNEVGSDGQGVGPEGTRAP